MTGRRIGNSTPRAGFTLVEMVVSVTILSLIMAICMSVTILSTRARGTEGSSDRTSKLAETRAALDQIAAELKSAVQISTRSGNSITFFVPDRDNDGDLEWISYYKLGNDLMRSYNSIIPATFVKDIGSIDFTYVDKTGIPPAPVEGAEQLLMSCTNTQNASTALSSSVWECQYVNPSAVMPANAISWKVTRVQFLLRRKLGATGNVSVQIRAADSVMKPIGAAIATGSINVATTLPILDTWVEIPLNAAAGELSPGVGVALVVSSSTSSTNATINGVLGMSPPMAGTAECETANAGATWTTPDASAVLNFRMYGKITTLE